MAALSPTSAEDVSTTTARPQTPLTLFSLSFFWLPLNLFWTVTLLVLLQLRVEEFAPKGQEGTYLFALTILGTIAATIIEPVIGPISDGWGGKWGRRRPFVLVGTMVSLGFVLLFAYAQSFPLLILGFFGIQVFLNTANGAYQALLPDNVPASQHGEASAYMGVSKLGGQLAAIVLLFLLASKFINIPQAQWVLIALLFVGMCITVFAAPDSPAPPDERKTIGEALATLKDIGFREYPDFFGLLYSRAFINLAYASVVTYLLFYLRDSIDLKEEAQTQQVLVLLAATVSGLIGTIVFGRFADKISKKKLIYIASALMGIAAVFFAFAPNMITVLILAFIFGTGWGAFSAVDWALAVNLLPEGKGAAKYMAIWHICETVPQIVAYAGGLYADPLNRAFGNGFGWRVVMFSTVIFLAIGTYLLRSVRERVIATEARTVE